MVTATARMAAAVLAAAVSVAHGLHEDQAGVNDWTVRNLGAYAHGVFLDDDLALVATTQATIGAVRMTDGEVVWRETLPTARSAPLASRVKHELFATASANACVIELWATPSGGVVTSDSRQAGLEWDAKICDNADADATGVLELLDNDFNNDGTPDVAALTPFQFVVLDGVSGRVLHEVDLDKSIAWQGLVEAAGSATGGKRKRPSIMAYGVDIKTGKLEVRKLANSGATLDPVSGLEGVSADEITVLKSGVAKVGSALLFVRKESGALVAFDCVANQLQELTNAPSIKGSVQSLGSARFFATDAGVIYAVDGELKIAEALKGVEAAAIGVSGASVIAAVQSSTSSGTGDEAQCGPISRVLVQSASGVTEIAFPEPQGQSGARGLVEKIIVGDSSTGTRAIFVFEDASAVGIEIESGASDASTLFVREEALANVVEAVAVDLPPTDEVGSLGDEAAHVFAHGSHASILMFRLKDQVRTVQRFVQSLFGAATQHLSEFVASQGKMLVQAIRGELPRAESLSQGEMFSFGFRRVLVLRSASGKVFGLNSADGSLLWAAQSPGSRLFVTRAREAGLDHPAEVAIVDEAHGRVTWRNAITGAVTRVEDIDTPLAQIAVLPGDIFPSAASSEEDVSPAAVLIALDHAQRVHVLPSSRTESVLQLEDQLRALHFVVYSNETGALTGYAVDPSQRAGVELWSMIVPASQTLLAVEGQSGGALNNPGIKRGDGAVLVKFVDPHLLMVATQSGPHLQVSILNGISGRVISRFTHKKSTGPVHAVLADNTVTYSFWNQVKSRQEVSVVGLFEGEIGPRELNIWSSRPNMGSGKAMSAFDDSMMPNVQQKTFYTERAIAALGVTKTRFGIADRRVLIGTANGAVNMQLPQILSPRRPVGKLSDMEKEEGLMLYAPELPLIPTQTITYYESIPQLRLIRSFATRLESTSLVLAAGLDIFYTRVMPSRGFDVLDEDFASGLLLALIAALLALTIYLSKAVGKSTLDETWK